MAALQPRESAARRVGRSDPASFSGVIMRRTLLLTALAAGLATAAAAQPAALRLTVDAAVTMALEHNVDLGADRIDPQISDTRLAAAAGAFRPSVNSSVNSNNQLLPPTSLLFPVATQTDVVTTNAGVSQKLPWYGTSYSVGWK